MIATREALARIGRQLTGTRVVVQGFGNVGSVAADLMSKAGALIIGVADKAGGVYDAKGVDIADLLQWTRKHGEIAGYAKGEPLTNEQLLALECDVLVPAATENVITRKNAPQIKAKIVCEGANGPTTAAADEILERQGIFVIPDILANAGGVTVSYFEWVQDRGGYFWDEATVNQRLELIMTRSFAEVMAMADRHKVSNRIACYMLAVDRVAAVHRLRGMYA
jgi:glutamate dehydrogenase (NAD(P)+)